MSFVFNKRLTIFDYVNGVFVALVSLICLVPFLYVVCVSLTDVEVYVPFVFRLVPSKFSLDAYRFILGTSTFTDAFFSTALVTCVGTAIALIVTYPASYALTKREMPLYGLFSGIVVFTLVFSAGIIPTFTLVRSLGLMNTYWSLMLPIATDAWSLIVVKSFLDSLPRELEDSAKIDGCTDIGVFLRIILPLSLASIATFTLFFAVARWNIYFDALLYINDNAKRTLQVLVKSMVIDNNSQSAGSATGWGDTQMPSEVVRSATVIVAVLPILVVYPFLQRYFVKGVMLGSIKG